MNENLRLKPEQLTCRCADEDIAPMTGGEAPLLPGQQRGMRAVETGFSLKKPYFNITVSGPSRSGKTTMVEQLASRRAAGEPPGRDLCIAPNFEEPNRPKVMYLSPGHGMLLNRLIDNLLKILDEQIPRLVEQPAIKAHLQELAETYNQRVKELTGEVEKLGAEKGIFIQTSQQGVTLIPLADGKPMSDEDFIALAPEKREKINEMRREVLARMSEINPVVMELEKERRDASEDYMEASIRQLVTGNMAGIRQRAEEDPPLADFLNALEEEIVEKRFLFLPEAEGAKPSQPFGVTQFSAMREQFSRNCKVNVLVNRGAAKGAPVIVENNPTFNNLIGGVDFIEDRGVLKTDFNQIRAGSLIQASGGYLILQAQDVLQYPVAYMALKRALRSGKIILRDQFTEMGLRSGAHLEPDPVDFDTKVVIVGDDRMIQMMLTMDDEFAGLFKVHADFSQTLLRSDEVMAQLTAYLSYHAAQQELLPPTNGALARVVEEASRKVSHQNRFSAQVNELMDVLIEADLVARSVGQTQLTRELVEQALVEKQHRHGKIEEAVKREISEGTILLDCAGAAVGQVNALAVYQVGRVSFGIPTRITAQAYAGRRGLINIEREADLSGRIHTKGMLILNGYLGRLFARKRPLALSLSITFEQNYGGIEGDSATCAEFFAALSAISLAPIKQAIAVTGSMNQHGEVQPIGGVNEKVTGFYGFAKEHDFPEGCGVIIPAVNQVNLLLSDEIIRAVEAGRFSVYAIRRIEEGLEIITGKAAGEMTPDGAFPADSVYGLAMEQLRVFNQEAGAQDDEPAKAPKEETRPAASGDDAPPSGPREV
ncbi:MAG: AAA family ATPase [SAR324 cluster bacterium]|nr:AAA family ATPase [SAR324 cluster bacterium]